MSKLEFEVKGTSAKIVRDLARNEHTDEPDIIGRSIYLMNFVMKERHDGSKVIIKKSDGQEFELDLRQV